MPDDGIPRIEALDLDTARRSLAAHNLVVQYQRALAVVYGPEHGPAPEVLHVRDFLARVVVLRGVKGGRKSLDDPVVRDELARAAFRMAAAGQTPAEVAEALGRSIGVKVPASTTRGWIKRGAGLEGGTAPKARRGKPPGPKKGA